MASLQAATGKVLGSPKILFLIVALGALIACADGRPNLQASVPLKKSTPCPEGSRIPDRIRFGLVGFWGTKEATEAFSGVAEFLRSQTGLDVELVNCNTYDELVDLLATEGLEVALLPPFAYVKAKARIPCLRLLRTMVNAGAVHYSSYLIVRADSPVTRVEDLKGRSIAFVEPSSASGYLFPSAFLARKGFNIPTDFRKVSFLGGHEKVIEAVIKGEADAGATFQGALKRARAIGLDTASLRVLAIVGRIPADALVASPSLHKEVLARLEAAFDRLNTTIPEGRRALSRLDITGFVATEDSFYDEVRHVLTDSGLNAKAAP